MECQSTDWAKRRADLFALAEEWLGAGAATEDEGLEHLARRYFGAFGPATPDEVADWAGVPRAFVQPALEQAHGLKEIEGITLRQQKLG